MRISQIVKFDTIPTTNPDEAIDYARYVVNASTGIGMFTLEQIVKKHIPIVKNDEVLTIKKIIRTERYECPCCATDLTALVKVYCEGIVTDEWKKVEGLYEVSILPDSEGCGFSVKKLSRTTIDGGRISHLPRKSYPQRKRS